MSGWQQWLLQAAIIIYCLWNARDWNKIFISPQEKWNWVVLALWLLPVFVYWLFSAGKKAGSVTIIEKKAKPLLLGSGILLSFLGVIGSLNTLCYLGLAVALTALVPFSLMHVIWIISAIAWMPAFGWFGSWFFPQAIFLLRIIVVLIGVSLVIYILDKRSRGE